MENVWVPVPYLVLSTEVDHRGRVDKHLLTPFGYLDIHFPGVPEDSRYSGYPYEVTVAGDFDTWRCDDSGPVAFRDYLLHFVHEIVASNLGRGPGASSQLKVRLVAGDSEAAGCVLGRSVDAPAAG